MRRTRSRRSGRPTAGRAQRTCVEDTSSHAGLSAPAQRVDGAPAHETNRMAAAQALPPEKKTPAKTEVSAGVLTVVTVSVV